MSATQELAVVPPKETALQVFQKPAGLDPYIERIREEVAGHVPDLTTDKGRKAIASLAFKVRKSRKALDDMGKDLVADLKEIPKKIDAERKRMRDTLDALADELRRPLDEWEAAEEARKARHQGAIDKISLRLECRDLDSVELRQNIEWLEGLAIDETWEEFELDALQTKDKALTALREALAAREKHEAEQTELEELRRKQAEQEQKDRDAAIAREAEERARREAEEKAQAEREAVAKREADAKAEAEQLRQNAELAEKRRIAAEQQAEIDRKESAERERVAAEQAEQNRIKAAEQAAAAERQRIADERAEAERQAAIRADNEKHRGAINRAALEAFIAGGMPEDCAKQAVVLIAKRQIPNIVINY